ncbi:MAG: ABC transporter permease subunit [Thermoleophilia bacterium]|nr:ABC transporter permease subunit [Thermoleophilia bacterium]
MSSAVLIAGYALRETLRRRVFPIVLVLTTVFLGLFALGTREAFQELRKAEGSGVLDAVPLEEQRLAGATLLGLAMFGTLFLGAVLAAFLTLSAVRGDAERGLLQPLVVRPVGREQVLLGRLVAAGTVCSLYVTAVFLAAALINRWAGGWWPDAFLLPALELAGAVVVIAALSLLGSVFLSATANGIAVFMIFGAGLVAGLLGQIGEALRSQTLMDVAHAASWALPFEALYQDALAAISARSLGLTQLVLQLGPFGGAKTAGGWLAPWTIAYVALVVGGAILAFRRRDL